MGRYRVRLANVHLMIKNAYILQSFLKAGKEEYISGETLAKEHKISRVAINGRIRKLEETGLHFEAAPRRGYRLQEDPAELHTDLLQAHLLIKQPKAINPASVHLLDAVDSTNLEVERRLGSGADAPLAVIAKSQTQGRGRMGRTWHSEHSGNLYLSVGFRPQVPGADLSSFSLWAGIRLAQALRQFSNLPVQVKWPNDLVVNGRKLAGILCEAKLELDCVQTLVFGLGLNVNQKANTLPEGLRTPATSLYSLRGKPIPIHELTVEVLKAVIDGFHACQKSASGEKLQQEFNSVDALLNQPVTTENGPVETEGTACGIDKNGNLQLETSEGKKILIHAGDVSLRKSPHL